MSREDRFSDRLGFLRTTQREMLGELARIRREEEYLQVKLRQAHEQLRYYEGLLSLVRRDMGRTPGLTELLRRMG